MWVQSQSETHKAFPCHRCHFKSSWVFWWIAACHKMADTVFIQPAHPSSTCECRGLTCAFTKRASTKLVSRWIICSRCRTPMLCIHWCAIRSFSSGILPNSACFINMNKCIIVVSIYINSLPLCVLWSEKMLMKPDQNNSLKIQAVTSQPCRGLRNCMWHLGWLYH